MNSERDDILTNENTLPNQTVEAVIKAEPIIDDDKDDKPKVNDPKEIQNIATTFFGRFKYLDTENKLKLVVAQFFCSIGSASSIYITVIYGNVGETLATYFGDDLLYEIKVMALKNTFLGINSIVCLSISVYLWESVKSVLEKSVRRLMFKKITNSDIAWYDEDGSEKITQLYQINTTDYVEGCGSKNDNQISSVFRILTGLGISFYHHFVFTFVALAIIPVIVTFVKMFLGYKNSENAIKKDAYLKASSLSSQGLTAIRTVKSLNGQEFELSNFDNAIDEYINKIKPFSLKKAVTAGFFNTGFLLMFIHITITGGYFIADQRWNMSTGALTRVGDVFTVMWCFSYILVCTSYIGPALEVINLSKRAGYVIGEILEKKDEIIEDDPTKKKRDYIVGKIDLKNVTFSYPTRKNITVLNKINLTIPAGKKVAFVGETGCGKSSILQCIERFYDVNSGEILIDDVNVKEYNLKNYRKYIRYVAQEPALFAMTIKENLLLAKSDATDEELIQVLKDVNAWDFISAFHMKMDTFVGSGGSQLSGGQKQRISIARAILEDDVKILLLDESTSALDKFNEAALTKVLDETMQNCTKIVVAHRLSTITNSDIIFALKKGKVFEQGTHEELIKIKGGFYAEMWRKQDEAGPEESRTSLQSIFSIIPSKDENKDEKVRKVSKVYKNNKVVPVSSTIQFDDDDNNNGIGNTVVNNPNIIDQTSPNLAQALKQKKIPYTKMWKDCDGCKRYVIQGFFVSLITGLNFPMIGYFYGLCMEIFMHLYLQKDGARGDLFNIFLACIGLYLLSLFCWMIQSWSFDKSGIFIETKLRKLVYKKLLYYDIQFFDDPKISVSSLVKSLEDDCTLISFFTTSLLGLLTQTFCSFFYSFQIAFLANWKLAQVSILIIPILLTTGYFTARLQKISANKLSNSDAVIIEVIKQIKTVRAMNILNHLSQKFDDELEKDSPSNFKLITKALLHSFSIICSQMIMGGLFYIGALFIVNDGLSYKNMTIVCFTIFFASFSIGSAMVYIDTVQEAITASIKIYDFLGMENQIKYNDGTSKTTKFQGKIEFKNVCFKYPHRSEQIFTDLNLTIVKGQNVAFVGKSGTGKSTVIQLILRFYQPDSGDIYIDDINYKTIDLHVLRGMFGLIGQEPFLFNDSIGNNIKYNVYNAKQDKIVEASVSANAFDFINKDKLQGIGNEDQAGFNKNVGNGGNKLSGGQKQRVAIARAVFRSPIMYLFDEATSALDSVAESVVLESLDRISEGKTTISIAHKVVTILKCDTIFVIKNKKIFEKGSFDELIQMQGHFFEMNKETIEEE